MAVGKVCCRCVHVAVVQSVSGSSSDHSVAAQLPLLLLLLLSLPSLLLLLLLVSRHALVGFLLPS
jgi:hypothetical protein